MHTRFYPRPSIFTTFPPIYMLPNTRHFHPFPTLHFTALHFTSLHFYARFTTLLCTFNYTFMHVYYTFMHVSTLLYTLPHSQVPATSPYPEPARSSPQPNIPLPEDPSYYYHPLIYTWVSPVVSFPQVSPPKPSIHLSSP